MAKLALVAPISIQEHLQEMGQMGDYHLLIAPKVLEQPAAYERYYRRYGGSTTVIMDNGVIETGDPGSADQLIDAARLVNADYVVLPDVPDDAKETLALALEAAELIAGAGRWKLIPVVQGKTEKEYLSCARAFKKQLPLLGALAVPRSVVANIGTRFNIVQHIHETLRLPVHLLGLSNHLLDDLNTANSVSGEVMGLDSAIPIYCHYLMRQGWESAIRPKRPNDYWSWKGMQEYSLQNIARLRGWLKGVNFVPTPIEEAPSLASADELTPDLP